MAKIFIGNFKTKRMNSISIVILTRNRKLLLKNCLDSLIFNKKLNYKILVVDNNSSDGTQVLLKQYKSVSIINNKQNLGVARARNIGIKRLKSDYIVFMDDDAFIEKDSFSKIIHFLQKNKKVGIIGPKILYPSGKIQESARTFPSFSSIIWRGTFLHRIFPKISFYKNYVLSDFDHLSIKEVDWVMGACQIIRKEVFKSIGLFDEKYFVVYDDIDFCYRAKKAGWKIIYYPNLRVYHRYARESAKGIITKAKFEHIKSIFRYFYKIYFNRM